MEYRHRSLLQDLPPIEEDTDLEYSSQDRYGTSFSYYESIQEFNQYRYNNSYSMYNLWNHLWNHLWNNLVNLLCRRK
jgi:hypothetical protein